MRDERGHWYLLTGVLLGIILGVVYAWSIAPVEYVDVSPITLRADYQDSYRAAVASSFAATGDLERANARLGLLGDPEIATTLAAQAQRYLAESRLPSEAQALASLAAALGHVPTPVPSYTQVTDTPEPTLAPSNTPKPAATKTLPPTVTTTPTLTATEAITVGETLTPTITPTLTRTRGVTRTPRPTNTPRPTITKTPLPTFTPSPTMGLPFVLDNQIKVCNPTLGESQVQVFVSDAAGVEIPGVEIILNWDGGEESFYTGLKPEIGVGYADYTLTPEVVYTLQVAEGGEIIPNLTAPECTEGDERYWGSWRMWFTQP